MNPTKKSLQQHKRQACMRRCGTPEATKASDLRVVRCFRGRCSTSQRDSTGRLGIVEDWGSMVFLSKKYAKMQVAPQNMWGSDFSKFSETATFLDKVALVRCLKPPSPLLERLWPSKFNMAPLLQKRSPPGVRSVHAQMWSHWSRPFVSQLSATSWWKNASAT